MGQQRPQLPITGKHTQIHAHSCRDVMKTDVDPSEGSCNTTVETASAGGLQVERPVGSCCDRTDPFIIECLSKLRGL